MSPPPSLLRPGSRRAQFCSSLFSLLCDTEDSRPILTQWRIAWLQLVLGRGPCFHHQVIMFTRGGSLLQTICRLSTPQHSAPTPHFLFYVVSRNFCEADNILYEGILHGLHKPSSNLNLSSQLVNMTENYHKMIWSDLTHTERPGRPHLVLNTNNNLLNSDAWFMCCSAWLCNTSCDWIKIHDRYFQKSLPKTNTDW